MLNTMIGAAGVLSCTASGCKNLHGTVSQQTCRDGQAFEALMEAATAGVRL